MGTHPFFSYPSNADTAIKYHNTNTSSKPSPFRYTMSTFHQAVKQQFYFKSNAKEFGKHLHVVHYRSRYTATFIKL